MSSLHAAVWLDHQEARIFDVDATAHEVVKIEAPRHHLHRHPKGVGWDKAKPADAERYLHDVAEQVADAEEILVVGPGSAKADLVKHLHRHHPGLVARVVGVETVDHPTDGQLLAYARTYFKAADRLRGTPAV